MKFIKKYDQLLSGGGLYYLNQSEYKINSYNAGELNKVLWSDLDDSPYGEIFIDQRMPVTPFPFKKKVDK